LHAGEDHPLGAARWLPLRPDIPSAIFGVGIAPRVLEPGVLVRGMINHEVDEDAHAALLGAVGKFDKIAEGAVTRIDAVVIGDVIAVVATGRGLERHQPDRRDAEAVQIVQPAHQPLEIADPVAIGIHVGADRQAIDDGILVPEIVDHGCPRLPRESTHVWGFGEGAVWVPKRRGCAPSRDGGVTARWPAATPEACRRSQAKAPPGRTPPRMVRRLGHSPWWGPQVPWCRGPCGGPRAPRGGP